MSDWLAVCDGRDRQAVGAAVRHIDAAGSLEFAATADAARRTVFESAPGELGVIVGELGDGVSDVNLAAAVAQDGNARCVVLARRDVTGSLRSRAARAGVDLVVRLDTTPPPGAARAAGDDGGRRPADPLSPSPLPSSVRHLGDDLSQRSPVIVFCSGRGGVGKTSVVAMASACAASWGMRVCALDLDLSCGNLYSCFGLAGGVDLVRLVGPPEGVEGLRERLGVCSDSGVQVLGPCELPETAELVSPLAGELITFLVHEYDLVLVDTPSCFTDAVAQAAQLADRLVLVCDGRPGSTASLARTGGLAVRLGVARTRMVRLENRVSPRARHDGHHLSADEGLDAVGSQCVLDGGDEVPDLLGAGRAVELAGSFSPFAESIAALMARMLSELGRLPDHEDAARAAASGEPRRRGLFGSRWGAR